MKMILPIDAEAAFIDTTGFPNVYPDFNGATVYGVQMMVGFSRRVYEARVTTAGNGTTPEQSLYDPDTNPTGEWLLVSATNPYKPFDGKASDPAVSTGTKTYEFTAPGPVDTIGLANVLANSIIVRVMRGGVQVYSFGKTPDPTPTVISPTTYTALADGLVTDEVFTNVPAIAGDVIEIQFSAPGEIRVGQIVLGAEVALGCSTKATKVGYQDFSRIERDEFGDATLIKRGYSRTVDYRFMINWADLAWVQRVVIAQRATPSFFFIDDDLDFLGATVFGYAHGTLDVSISEKDGFHRATLGVVSME